ncbi:MAG: SRPBCC domain-containing protein [Gemmatimonadales bacterium]
MMVKTVVLPCSPERAFALFTERASEWWPASRRHTSDPASTIRVEATGRFFERAGDGTEVDLGVVRLFSPPRSLVLDWYPGTGPRQPTRVEITFEAVAGGTRVTVLHDSGPAGPDLFGRAAPKFAESWEIVLASLAAGAGLLD